MLRPTCAVSLGNGGGQAHPRASGRILSDVYTSALVSPLPLARSLRRDAVFGIAWFALRMAAVLSLAELTAVTSVVWHVLFWFPFIARRATENLEIAFPGASRLWVSKHCKYLAALSAEVLYVATGRTLPPYPLEPEARWILDRCAGKPVVLVSMHLGNWERVARSLASACTLTVVTKAPSDLRYQPWFRQLRRGLDSIERDRKYAGIKMLRTLRRKEVLGIPMDLKTRSECAEVFFFGRSTRAPLGPAQLALRTGAVVLLASATPNETVDVVRIDSGEAESAQALTAEIYRQFEQRIRNHPEAWLWLHKRWS